MLFLSPVLIGAVALFIKRSRFGMAIRSASSNADAARLAGHLRRTHVDARLGHRRRDRRVHGDPVRPDAGLRLGHRLVRPDDPAARARRRGDREHDEPAHRAVGGGGPRRRRAAAAVELPARGPGRGGAVRDHPRRPAAPAARRERPRGGEGLVGGRPAVAAADRGAAPRAVGALPAGDRRDDRPRRRDRRRTRHVQRRSR